MDRTRAPRGACGIVAADVDNEVPGHQGPARPRHRGRGSIGNEVCRQSRRPGTLVLEMGPTRSSISPAS